jgi:hypothetical protein
LFVCQFNSFWRDSICLKIFSYIVSLANIQLGVRIKCMCLPSKNHFPISGENTHTELFLLLSHRLIKLRLKNPKKSDLDRLPMGIELKIEGLAAQPHIPQHYLHIYFQKDECRRVEWDKSWTGTCMGTAILLPLTYFQTLPILIKNFVELFVGVWAFRPIFF